MTVRQQNNAVLAAVVIIPLLVFAVWAMQVEQRVLYPNEAANIDSYTRSGWRVTSTSDGLVVIERSNWAWLLHG